MKNSKFLPTILALVLLLGCLAVPAMASERPTVTEKSALVIDRSSGEIHYSKDADRRVDPADLAKLMTALVAVEAAEAGKVSLNDMVTVTETMLDGLPEEKKTEDRLIKGCQSRVWLDCRKEDGKLFFDADSDAVITRGIISMLVNVYSGCSAAEILADDFSFLNELGLKENLSPTRANGLVSMIATIRAKAAENE